MSYTPSNFVFRPSDRKLKFSDVLDVITASYPEMPRAEKKRQAQVIYSEEACADYFISNMFQVAKRVLPDEQHGFPIPPTYLSIKRHDKEPIADWRAMQKIKNAICGKEWEGIEIYPAETRLVDTCNQYHMFCFEGHIPIYVFTEREVLTSEQAEQRSETMRQQSRNKNFSTKQR